jgi:hypothetical protein
MERPMPVDMEILRRHFADKDYLFTAHASDRAAQRLIRSAEIEEVISTGRVIEDYPDDKYGPSCLLLGMTKSGRSLHVQVSYPPNVKIITVYEPSPDEWETDLKTRKKP